MKKKTPDIFAVIILMLGVILMPGLYSCSGSQSVPGEFISVPEAKWHYGKTFTFNAGNDTVANDVSAVELALRHSNDYPYANLWVELAYRSADSIVADTFNIVMADEFGKWLGSGSGPVVLLTDTLPLRHEPDGASEFALRHIMRVDVLPEIEQIGLSYIPAQK